MGIAVNFTILIFCDGGMKFRCNFPYIGMKFQFIFLKVIDFPRDFWLIFPVGRETNWDLCDTWAFILKFWLIAK